MSIEVYQVTQTSPLRHFLQGLESSDSTEDPEYEMTSDDLANIQHGSSRAKLVISFKNPFKKKETVIHNLNITSISCSPAQYELTFRSQNEPVFFSRGHEGRWSKIALIFIKNAQERMTVDTFRQYVPQQESISCSSLNGRLTLSLESVTPEEKKILLPKTARRLFSEEETPCASISIRPDTFEIPSEGQCLQIGLVTKIACATLRIPRPIAPVEPR